MGLFHPLSGFIPSPGSQLAKNVSTSVQYLSAEQNPDLPQRDNAPNPCYDEKVPNLIQSDIGTGLIGMHSSKVKLFRHGRGDKHTNHRLTPEKGVHQFRYFLLMDTYFCLLYLNGIQCVHQ